MTNFLWLYLSHNFTLYCLRLRPIKYVSCIIFHYRSVFKLIARHLFLHFLLFLFFFFFFFRWFPVPEDSVTIVVDSLDRGLMNSNFFFPPFFLIKRKLLSDRRCSPFERTRVWQITSHLSQLRFEVRRIFYLLLTEQWNINEVPFRLSFF